MTNEDRHRDLKNNKRHHQLKKRKYITIRAERAMEADARRDLMHGENSAEAYRSDGYWFALY